MVYYIYRCGDQLNKIEIHNNIIYRSSTVWLQRYV